MHSYKKASFSPDCKYFACFNCDDKLLIWETQNNAFIDCKFDSSISSTCSSLHWIPYRNKSPSPKKAKVTRGLPAENQLLSVGTIKGDILLYNVSRKNLYLHLVGRHTDAINDMYFQNETDTLFTCSGDKSIAAWDISTGKQKIKWTASDDPVLSICVIDENNMLSSTTSITWWKISEKQAVKKFNGHSAEIFKLLPVNAVSLNSCYFLSAAVSDEKIKVWSLSSNDCETPVASFVLPEQLYDWDISKASSKDKPLILAAVTKDGSLHLFEHVLNGNLNQPIHPKVSVKITPQSSSPSVICLKLFPDSESCIIAFGSNKDNMTFKHIKVKELLMKSETINKVSVNESHDKPPTVKETTKGVSINGLKSSSKCSENSQKKTQLDSVVSSYRRKLRSSSIGLSSTDPEIQNLSENEDSKSIHKDRNHVQVIDVKDPKRSADLFLKGLRSRNQAIIDAAFCISDTEFISKCVENLPSNSLKIVLEELSNRLCHHLRYSSTLSKWLKEISIVHLNSIMQCKETEEVLHRIGEHISSLEVHETISKMSALKGLLSFTAQISSSDESNSESEEDMEL